MDYLSDDIFIYIGSIALAFILVFTFLLILTIILTYLMFRNSKLINRLNDHANSFFLKVILFMLDSMYIPAKKVTSFLGGNDEMMVDTVASEIRNIILKKKFINVPFEKRIILIPQCLRNIDCPAKFNSVKGAKCVKCGKCKIKAITEKAEELGYMGTFICPGGSFVKRIIKATKPHAVIGVGCPEEVNMGLIMVAGKGIPVQGVVLLRSGCVETDIDLETMYETMELSREDPRESEGSA